MQLATIIYFTVILCIVSKIVILKDYLTGYFSYSFVVFAVLGVDFVTIPFQRVVKEKIGFLIHPAEPLWETLHRHVDFLSRVFP